MMRENQKGLDGLIQEVINQMYKRTMKKGYFHVIGPVSSFLYLYHMI